MDKATPTSRARKPGTLLVKNLKDLRKMKMQGMDPSLKATWSVIIIVTPENGRHSLLAKCSYEICNLDGWRGRCCLADTNFLFDSKDFHLSKAMVRNKQPIRQCASLFLEFTGLGNPKALFNKEFETAEKRNLSNHQLKLSEDASPNGSYGILNNGRQLCYPSISFLLITT